MPIARTGCQIHTYDFSDASFEGSLVRYLILYVCNLNGNSIHEVTRLAASLPGERDNLVFKRIEIQVTDQVKH